MSDNNDIDRRIGARIKIERESRGWSLTELAERAAVSRAMIHKVERGDSSPTANLLGKLSGALGLSMSTLMARAEAPEGRLIRKADQPLWTDPDTGYLRRQVFIRPDHPLEIVEVTMPSGKSAVLPAASYAFIRQVIWLTEGQLVITDADGRHVLSAGDCLGFGPPADVTIANESDAPARYVVALARS